MRFLGHFVSVYERTAPPFAHESARWSLDGGCTAAYAATGVMFDLEQPTTAAEALQQLPAEERCYTGSSGTPRLWPYGL